MNKVEDIAADERAYVRSLREHERYAQRERSEAEAYRAEKIRLAANERVFGKKYRSQTEIAQDSALEAFLSAPIRIAPGDQSPEHLTDSSNGAAAEGSALYEHDAEECVICYAGAELQHFTDLLPTANTEPAAPVAPSADVISAAPEQNGTGAAVAAPAPAPVSGSSSTVAACSMAFWCPPYREIGGRLPSHRPSAKRFLARYQRGLLQEDSDEDGELLSQLNGAAPFSGSELLLNGSSHAGGDRKRQRLDEAATAVTAPPGRERSTLHDVCW